MILNNGDQMQSNINYIPEKNWSIVSNETDIWEGELPYKTGDTFPTKEIEHRAEIANTNNLIYENDINEIYNSIISIFPEIDPMYGWQIREIVTNLPYFKNATNAWVGLIAGETPLIDTNEEIDIQLSEIIENSNFASIIQHEVRSRFLECISAYRVDVDLNNKPIITVIDSKNLICFVNKNIPSCIEVVVVFSIYKKDDGVEYIDFVEYHYNGYIKKSTFLYSNNCIGDLIDTSEEEAFEGKIKESPIVVFKHNAKGNNIYGTDQYRYWSASMLAGMRELQNILRLGERTREMIRKVPNSAIRKDPVDGSSTFFNKGTIGYNENAEKFPEMEYVVPEIRMEEAVKALERSIKQISMDTQLGIAFYDISVLGARLSADSIRASMYSASLESKRITTEMLPSLKELIVKLGYLGNIQVNKSKLSIEFFDGLPRDEKDMVDNIHKRLDSNNPSISLEDAIMKLDRVPLRIAKQKAAEIRQEKGITQQDNNMNIQTEDNLITDIDINNDTEVILEPSSLKPTAGENNIKENIIYEDNTVWENQMFPKPRDITQGTIKKEVQRAWVQKKLNTKA